MSENYTFYKIIKEAPVAWVYLNRPEKKNAMGPAAWKEIIPIFEDMDKDDYNTDKLHPNIAGTTILAGILLQKHQINLQTFRVAQIQRMEQLMFLFLQILLGLEVTLIPLIVLPTMSGWRNPYTVFYRK